MPLFFVIDDFYDLYVARFASSPSDWLNAFLHINGSGQYRPLTVNVFFWVCWQLFGFHPIGYHLVCLVTFVATAILAYRLFFIIFGSRIPAFVAASSFAFSSTHYEAMAWAGAFVETGAALAFILGIVSYVSGGIRGAVIWFIIALGCNETTAPFPAIAPIVALSLPGVKLDWESAMKELKRSLPLWLTLCAYALFRVTVAGLPLSHSGPFALNTNPSSIAALIAESVWNSLGSMPTFVNVQHANGLTGLVANVSWALILLMLFGFSIRFFSNAKRTATRWPLFVVGLLWFLIALSPLLIFSSNDWSYYNLEIPLMGLALTIGVIFATDNTSVTRISAMVTACLFALVNALAIYGPGGWSSVAGTKALARAASTLYDAYAALLNEAGDRRLTVNIFSKSDLENAKHISGDFFGLDALGGSKDSGTVVFSDAPIAQPVNVLAEWSPRDFNFIILGKATRARIFAAAEDRSSVVTPADSPTRGGGSASNLGSGAAGEKPALREKFVAKGTFAADPNPIKVLPGKQVGSADIHWNYAAISKLEVRVGSPAGQLFAAGGAVGNARTGEWVSNGMQFFLLDASRTGTPSSRVVASLAIRVCRGPDERPWMMRVLASAWTHISGSYPSPDLPRCSA